MSEEISGVRVLHARGAKDGGTDARLVVNGETVPRAMTQIQIAPRTPFTFFREREPYVRSIVSGRRYALPSIQDAKHKVRRVLDIGAGEGAFACWAYVQWPGCWVDMLEYDDELRPLAALNAPPGAKVLEGGDLVIAHYDVVRLASWAHLGEGRAALLRAVENVPILIVDFVEAPTEEERRARTAAENRRKVEAWEAILAKNEGRDEFAGAHALCGSRCVGGDPKTCGG
jgi:hypothetical protein